MLQIFKPLLKNYLIGLGAVLLIVWTIEPFDLRNFGPFSTFWIGFILSTPLSCLITARFIHKKRELNTEHSYIYSVSALVLTWIIGFYFGVLVSAVEATFSSDDLGFIDILIAATINTLWIFAIIGLIHGILGGIFLTKRLKKKEKKRHTTLN